MSKRKKLAAAFASASMVATPVMATESASLPTPAAPQAAQNDNNQCYIAPNMSGGRIYRDRSCVRLSDFLANPDRYRDQAMYTSLTTLFNSSAMGRQILEEAADEGYRLCDMELSSTVNAVHWSGINKIGVDYQRGRSQTEYITSVIHELGHFYQSHYGADNFDARRNVYENQRVNITMETAAPVIEVLVVYEAGLNGAINWREDLPTGHYKRQWFNVFDARYNEVRAEGGDHNLAMNEAAKETWQLLLRNQFRLDFYNNEVVRNTLMYSNHVRARDANYTDRRVNQMVNDSGRIDPNIQFTDYNALPGGDALFGNNDMMRQAFEATEWYRQSLIWGRDNPGVQRNRQILEERENPFVNANFDDVICKLRQGMQTGDAFDSEVPRNQPPANLVQNDVPAVTTKVRYNFG